MKEAYQIGFVLRQGFNLVKTVVDQFSVGFNLSEVTLGILDVIAQYNLKCFCLTPIRRIGAMMVSCSIAGEKLASSISSVLGRQSYSQGLQDVYAISAFRKARLLREVISAFSRPISF